MNIIIELFILYLAYRTFCRMPSYLCIVFVLSFILVKSINIYDIVEDKKLNNEKLEEKCRGLKDGSIRNNGLWLTYDIISLLVTLLILYYGFISLFVEMKPKNCVDLKSIKKSLSLISNNSKSNSFKYANLLIQLFRSNFKNFIYVFEGKVSLYTEMNALTICLMKLECISSIPVSSIFSISFNFSMIVWNICLLID